MSRVMRFTTFGFSVRHASQGEAPFVWCRDLHGTLHSKNANAKRFRICYKNGTSIFTGKGMMSIQSISRCAIALFLAALVSGCSLMGFDDSGRGDDCAWNRSACMYEGAYEPGEKDYAEEEARRLNKTQSTKLRRW